MLLHPIYTETNNCQDCYKCVRECPVKAIKIENHTASIIQELCIYCGHCTQICPVEAKKVRDDIDLVKQLLRKHSKVVASVAPSFKAEFTEYSEESFITSLKTLGFSHVSETALGAEMVSAYTKNYLEKQHSGTHISPCCPAVVELITRYFPQHKEKIIPVKSPMLAHADMLKQQYGADTIVVFVGPCIAKKHEAESTEESNADAVITFGRLRQWLEEENISTDIEVTEEARFNPSAAGDGSIYPVDGGMISGVRKNARHTDATFMTFSGVTDVWQTLKGLDEMQSDQNIFLELMACSGGCINGPGNTCWDSLAGKRLAILKNRKDKSNTGTRYISDLTAIEEYYTDNRPVIPQQHSAEAVKETLHRIGKYQPEDELNCGGCGYETCRDFACAILEGKAEEGMCVSYMRSLAQEKASLLLKRMPYGVVLVNDKMQVVEFNSNFAEITEQNDIKHADLRNLISYHSYFASMLESGEAYLEKDISVEGKFFHLSIFTLQKFKMVCGIIRNLKVPGVMREEVVNRTQEVIQKNLETVQQVASLLGENASETENLLNSIAEFHQEDNAHDKK